MCCWLSRQSKWSLLLAASGILVNSGCNPSPGEPPAAQINAPKAGDEVKSNEKQSGEATPSKTAKDPVEKEHTSPVMLADQPFKVPDGDPAKLLKYIDELAKQQPDESASQLEQKTFVIQVLNARLEAADKILAQKATDEQRVTAVQVKLTSYAFLTKIVPTDPPKIEPFLAACEKDPNASIVALGKTLAAALPLLDKEEKSTDEAPFLAAFKEMLKSKPTSSAGRLQLASELIDYLQARGGESMLAPALFLMYDEFKDDPQAEIAQSAKQIRIAALLMQAQNISQEMESGKLDLLPKLLESLKAAIDAEPKLLSRTYQIFSNLQRALEFTEKPEDAVTVANAAVEFFGGYKQPRLVEIVKSEAEKTKLRVGLVGKFFPIDGVTWEGEKFDWAKYRGKVVLLDFWATWCGPCLAKLPHLRSVYKKYKDRGLEVLGISLDDTATDKDKESVGEKLAQLSLPWPSVYSGDAMAQGFDAPIPKSAGVTGIPFLLLLDREGKVLMINAEDQRLEKKLEELLPEKKP